MVIFPLPNHSSDVVKWSLRGDTVWKTPGILPFDAVIVTSLLFCSCSCMDAQEVWIADGIADGIFKRWK